MSAESNVGIEHGQTNAHGQAVADVVAEEQAEDLVAALEDAQLDVERERVFTSLSFSRMRTDWHGEHAAAMHRVRQSVDQVMIDKFSGAYNLMNDIYEVVRTPVIDPETGEVQEDEHGFPVWERTELGFYIEDWTVLTTRQKEDFLFRLTTSLFSWEQDAADLWGEAMFAKALWTEAFATAFDAPSKGTVDHRTAVGNMRSAEERYFAVYLATLSRRADALCKSLERLSQRLKDVMAT